MSVAETSKSATLPFLQGGGEMGELIRSFDWSQTSLGKPEKWHIALKQTVSMMLTTTFPVLVCWGNDYIQLYNDAFRPINGETKHPQAIGGSARDTYAEIWDTIGPMFAGVMDGNAIGFPDFMVRPDRNGYPEDCYFDFSYSPVRDEHGAVHGVLVICIETTEKVFALKKAKEAEAEMEKAKAETEQQRDRLKRFFMQAPAGICIMDGSDLVFELINPLYQQLFPGRELLGKPVLEAIPEIKGQPIWDILQNVYHTGETFEGSELLIPMARTDDGPVEDRYFNFIYQARRDNNKLIDGILVFAIEVTDSVLAVKELSKTQNNLKMAVTAAQLGTFDMG
jgi:two-component system sensor histidine kinase VicK